MTHPADSVNPRFRRMLQRPGERARFSGQVAIVGPRGGVTGVERTVIQHKKLPPPPKRGQQYLLVDPTKNGAGRRKKGR